MLDPAMSSSTVGNTSEAKKPLDKQARGHITRCLKITKLKNHSGSKPVESGAPNDVAPERVASSSVD